MWNKPLDWLGSILLSTADTLGRIVVLCRQILYWIKTADRKNVIAQTVAIGVDSLPVTLLTSLFTGMVLALQTGFSILQVLSLRYY